MVGIRIGSFTWTGPGAGIALLLIAIALIGVIVLVFKPRFAWSPLWVSASLWVAFFIYWGAAAANASAVKESESGSSRSLHANLLNLALLLLFVRVPGLKGRWLPMALGWVLAGWALQAAGFLLAAWARRHLGRHWSGAITQKVDHELVRSGPYRRVRHPIYSAMLAMYLGPAMVSGEWHGLVAVAIVALAYVRKIRLEERHLNGVFGPAYESYRRESWAIVPGLF
jgi:protein-S-isoprenylcysteine O-methyltransferase Ste14